MDDAPSCGAASGTCEARAATASEIAIRTELRAAAPAWNGPLLL